MQPGQCGLPTVPVQMIDTSVTIGQQKHRLFIKDQMRSHDTYKTSLGWHQRTARRVASHPVVIVLWAKLDTECDRQATFIETMRFLSCIVFELQRVICQKSPILTYSPAFGVPVGITPNFAEIFGVAKLESLGRLAAGLLCGVICMIRDPKFSRFDTIPACDGHRHTTTAYTVLV